MHVIKKYSFCVKVFCFFLLLILVLYFNIDVDLSSDFGKFPKIKLLNTANETSQEELVETLNTEKVDKINCSQWIVITTISLPTDDIKYIHDKSERTVDGGKLHADLPRKSLLR